MKANYSFKHWFNDDNEIELIPYIDVGLGEKTFDEVDETLHQVLAPVFEQHNERFTHYTQNTVVNNDYDYPSFDFRGTEMVG
ncbi:hypothetical protein [Synechococcus sp. MVIR-18-1]|uniref:hypothetical protein n=1 Tax=Synechococcus sp. MVIR-18-1 TaxID=1386941 RepID=UPI0016461469|nr:hypothetical protein [Synechococcus sp. MVIR-18-1]QNI75614.1 hypothetical protein SynMVIR181_00614 [Synechococcus sp. MVIR-18-1]